MIFEAVKILLMEERKEVLKAYARSYRMKVGGTKEDLAMRIILEASNISLQSEIPVGSTYLPTSPAIFRITINQLNT